MIKVLKISVASNNPYENVEILTQSEQMLSGIPDLFEESQFVFRCKDGLFVLPDYKVHAVQLRKYGPKPTNCLEIVRLLLNDELNFSNCYYICQERYGDYDIPQLFHKDAQFVFWTKTDGIMIVPDFQIIYARLK